MKFSKTHYAYRLIHDEDTSLRIPINCMDVNGDYDMGDVIASFIRSFRRSKYKVIKISESFVDSWQNKASDLYSSWLMNEINLKGETNVLLITPYSSYLLSLKPYGDYVKGKILFFKQYGKKINVDGFFEIMPPMEHTNNNFFVGGFDARQLSAIAANKSEEESDDCFKLGWATPLTLLLMLQSSNLKFKKIPKNTTFRYNGERIANKTPITLMIPE